MEQTLEGSVALVTGASSGIGEVTAEALAAAGASVSVAARRVDRLDALAKRIAEAPGAAETLVVEADVTNEQQAQAMVGATVERFGRLDILVNNAGVMLLGPIEGAVTDEWRRMIDLNLLGLLYCTHAALPHLLAAAQEGGRGVADVVNVSSVAGRIARRDNGVYAATKWGVVAFTESFRQEFTARHVRSTVIEPGATATELVFQNRPEVLEQMAKSFGGIEVMQSEDIARAVLYAVTQPRHVSLNEILIRPTEQER